MKVEFCRGVKELGRRAAADAASHICRAVERRGRARIVFATGASQFEVLAALAAAGGIDWSKVVGFHLDEGPFLNDTPGYRGAHPARDEVRRLLSDNPRRLLGRTKA